MRQPSRIIARVLANRTFVTAVLREIQPRRILPLLVLGILLLPSALALVPPEAPVHAACADGGCCIMCKMGKKIGKDFRCHGESKPAVTPTLSCSRGNPSPVTNDRVADLRFVLAPNASPMRAAPDLFAYAALVRDGENKIDHEPPVPPPRHGAV